MKKIIFFISILFWQSTFSQTQLNDGLIELAKAYKQYMFVNNPSDTFLKSLDKFENTELAFSTRLIKEIITENNSVLSEEFLKRPQDEELKQLYIIIHLNYELRQEKPRDAHKIIQELQKKKILTQDLIDNYYEIILTSYGNKVDPFDMSAINFDLNAYGLKDDTEKGILFLKIMRLCGLQIWGYINIPKPPNYKLALEYIQKFPTINGAPYYQFSDFSFPDFKIAIEYDKSPESYKGYYLNKYYETLLNHLICYIETDQDEKITQDFILGSILVNEDLYHYSEQEEMLKKLFTKVED